MKDRNFDEGKRRGNFFFQWRERRNRLPGDRAGLWVALRSTEEAKCQTGRPKGGRKSQTQTLTLPLVDSYNVLSWQFPCEQFSEYSAISIIPRNIRPYQ